MENGNLTEICSFSDHVDAIRGNLNDGCETEFDVLLTFDQRRLDVSHSVCLMV